MPQPLSRVKSNVSIFLGIEDNTATDIMWRSVVRVTNAWSRIDGLLAEMLSGFLRADFASVAAMYSAIVSVEARRAALLAAAKIANPQALDLISATLNSIKSSYKRRNEFSHHIWGYSPDLPDSILLIDPAVLIEQSAAVHQFVADGKFVPTFVKVGKATKMEPPPLPPYDLSRVFVYREAELKHQAKFAAQCVFMVNSLMMATNVKNPDVKELDKLLREPLVQRELERLNRKNDQQVPPSPPE